MILYYEDNDLLSVNQLTLNNLFTNRAASSEGKQETNTAMPANG